MSCYIIDTISNLEKVYSILKLKNPDKYYKVEKYMGYYKISECEKKDECLEIDFNFDIKVIYGDTDSIFVKFKFDRDDNVQNRLDTFRLATICGDKLTKEVFNRPPIEMEFEKVFQPFVLLTKKRYIGKKFDDMKDPFKCTSVVKSGIAITRRDYCNMVKKCYNEIINCVISGSDRDDETNYIEKCVEVYKRYIDDIYNFKIDIDDLVVSAQLAKTYSCSECKEKVEWTHLKCENNKCKRENLPMSRECMACGKGFKCVHKFNLAHVNLACKLLVRNDEANVNDRIPYLFFEDLTIDPNTKKCFLAESPKFFSETNMKYNRLYYTESLSKPVLAFLAVCFKEYPEEFKDILDYTNYKIKNEYGGKTCSKITDFDLIAD